ncbi:LuxR C-terminal-related transcriptional regulator [Pseudonocardia acidicola]|uniref:Response regulator transcription factor n=1 Tax=Pseudonocardia acidicola TaxID=2724939 RepID=A0ABX1SJ57_9PSEU|nr:response regulator transcription factor [Pseudonocardia acidicola]NMI00280.1 response regulator transcription factor [Pseudonocardia acidicola]
MTLRSPRVLVIDDHRLVASSLVLALAERGLDPHLCPVTGTAEILRFAEQTAPAVVLLDLELGLEPDGGQVDELAVVRTCHARRWVTLIVSASTDSRRVAAAIAAGAAGFVSKSAPLTEMLDVVCAAAAGHPVLTPAERAGWLDIDRRARAAERRDQARLKRLTARERQVLERLARGERAAAIAEEFVVSVTTVRSQIRSILTKLEVNSQLEAAAILRHDEPAPAPVVELWRRRLG